MNTANKITMIRVVLVPIFMVLFMIDNVMCHYAALGVFVLASITDAIDGHVARKYNQVTTFGKFVDPLADKVLTTAAFLILMYYDRMSVWALMIVLVSCLLYTSKPCPNACRLDEITIHIPANAKLRLITLNAGIPISSIWSDASNNFKSTSGINWNSIIPISIIQTAYIIASLMVFVRRFLFCAP